MRYSIAGRKATHPWFPAAYQAFRGQSPTPRRQRDFAAGSSCMAPVLARLDEPARRCLWRAGGEQGAAAAGSRRGGRRRGGPRTAWRPALAAEPSPDPWRGHRRSRLERAPPHLRRQGHPERRPRPGSGRCGAGGRHRRSGSLREAYLADPDRAERRRRGAALHPPQRETFYGGGERAISTSRASRAPPERITSSARRRGNGPVPSGGRSGRRRS
jgi:hypothetical protein